MSSQRNQQIQNTDVNLNSHSHTPHNKPKVKPFHLPLEQIKTGSNPVLNQDNELKKSTDPLKSHRPESLEHKIKSNHVKHGSLSARTLNTVEDSKLAESGLRSIQPISSIKQPISSRPIDNIERHAVTPRQNDPSAKKDIQQNKNNQNEISYQDLKKSYLSNSLVKLDGEAEYYETVRRLDECGKCWAGQRRHAASPFKTQQKASEKSLYQKDFVPHPIETKKTKLKIDPFTILHSDEPIDGTTTMKNDFKTWKLTPTESAKRPQLPNIGSPFPGRSGYRAEYIPWEVMPPNYDKGPDTTTVIRGFPFTGTSSYRENFHEQPIEPSKIIKRPKNKSPLCPAVPFLPETTNASIYKPFKVGFAPMFKAKQTYEPTPTYPNQFSSLYREDFVVENIVKCPARIFIDTHPNPRLQTMKSCRNISNIG